MHCNLLFQSPSIYLYLKSRDGLPDPKGSLSTEIYSVAFASASQEMVGINESIGR